MIGYTKIYSKECFVTNNSIVTPFRDINLGQIGSGNGLFTHGTMDNT